MKILDYNSLINNMDINPYGGDAWKGPGFHGDIRLINIVDNCIKNCTSFIETGTNRGNTLYYVSRNYNIKCFSCEVHNETPTEVIEYDNILFKQEPSPNFIYNIVNKNKDLLEETCLFWLDAHFGGGEEILFEEINYILKNFKSYYIFCDDIDIKNNAFSNNGYSIDRISNMSNENTKIFVPDYNDTTSEFHGLTGWCLLTNLNLENTSYIKSIL